RAASATVVVRAPKHDVSEADERSCGIRPKLALWPTRPVKAAGMRVDPPPSLAVQNGTIPAATAAADPPLEPPGVRIGSHGLRVGPYASGSVVGTMPSSGAFVRPTHTNPASR